MYDSNSNTTFSDFNQAVHSGEVEARPRPVPPEKGVFQLDHLHECDLEKKDYISCLKSSGHESEKCRLVSKKYLECRMEKNLMARQDMSELGFGKEADVLASREGKPQKQSSN